MKNFEGFSLDSSTSFFSFCFALSVPTVILHLSWFLKLMRWLTSTWNEITPAKVGGNSKFNIFKTIKPEFIVRLRRLSKYCAPFNILHGNQPIFFPSTLFFHRALQFFQSIASHHCTLFIFPINVFVKALDSVSFRFFIRLVVADKWTWFRTSFSVSCKVFTKAFNFVALDADIYMEKLIETPRLETSIMLVAKLNFS